MSINLSFKLTQAGLAACWNAKNTGTNLEITHVQLGSGNRAPDGTEVALVDAKEFVAIAAGSRVSPDQVRMTALFAGSAVAYSISEIGLWKGAPGVAGSVLVCYWSQAAGLLTAKAVGVDFIFAHDMVIGDATAAGAITVQADTTLAPALALVNTHEAKANPHPQYALASDLIVAAPVSLMAFFARASAPPGWLKANGAAISRVAYAGLYAEIGTRFGAGDGVNTFNLPDLRGEFIRGWDDGRGVDSGRVLGSWQAPTYIRSLLLDWTGNDATVSSGFGIGMGTANRDSQQSATPPGAVVGKGAGWVSVLDDNGSTGGQVTDISPLAAANPLWFSTRPRNVAMLGCIKYA